MRSRKLSSAEESALIRDWNGWILTQEDLAHRYDVPRSTVQSILRRHRERCVTVGGASKRRYPNPLRIRKGSL